MPTPLYLPQFRTTTLNVPGGLTAAQTTGIILTSVPSEIDTTQDGIICITYANPLNTDTAEYIIYTSIDGSNTLVGVTRGAEGYSAKTHNNGATIAWIVSKAHINRLNDKLTGVDTVAIEDVNQNEILRTVTTASAVNEITIRNQVTGTGPLLEATGGDTNIQLDLSSKGTGSVVLWSGAKARELLMLANVASAVNQIQISPAATTANPFLEALGDDTNVGLDLTTKGTGALTLWSGTKGRELLKLVNVASAVNEVQISPAATGANPIIEPTGDDTNIGLNVTPKGTGKLRLTANDFELVGAAANIQVNNADPKRAFYIPASAMTAATTNGAASGTIETATNKIIIPVFDFDTTTQEFVAVAIPSPHFWDASTVTVQFIWTAASGSGAVVWAAQGIAFSDDDAMDTAYGTEQTVTDTLITAVDDHHTAFTSAITIAGTPVAGDLVCLRFKRVPGDAGDTLGVDARLIGVKVRFGISQYDDQ